MEVRQMLLTYHEDIHRHGLLAEFEYLDQSPDFFWVPPGYQSPLNYDSVRAIIEATDLTLTEVEFSWDTLSIHPLSDEIATYSGIVRGRMLDTAGVELQLSVIESGTLIKRKSGWKLLSGQTAALAN